MRSILRQGRVVVRLTQRSAASSARQRVGCASDATFTRQHSRTAALKLLCRRHPGAREALPSARWFASSTWPGRRGVWEAPPRVGATVGDNVAGEQEGGLTALDGEEEEEEGGEEDGFYLDVDVMIVESTPETPQLASLAADVEATAPLLLQAVLDVPPSLRPPAPVAAVRRGAAGAELSVALCSDEYIRALNAEWRGVDEATDVLSFPQLDVADSVAHGDDDQAVASLFPAGHALLGDVIISVDTAARQAAVRGATLEEEVQVLLVHGLLHVMGYDHEDVSDEEAAAMAAEEERVLLRMGWGGVGLVTSAHTQTAPPPTGDAGREQTRSSGDRAVQRLSRSREIDVLLCDLDGTLLNSAGVVSPATRDALRAAQVAGIDVYVATGKARPGAIAALAASGLSSTASPICHVSIPGVFLNGVLVYAQRGKLAFQRQLPFDTVEDALSLAAASGVSAAAFTGDECFALAPSPLLDALHSRFYEPQARILPDIAALRAVVPPPVKVLMYAATAQEIDELRPRMEALLAGRAHVIQAVPEMLEVLPLGASKGAGAMRLLNALGVPPSRAAAIGDGENDLDMLKGVGLGLAMANAVPATRAAATHVLSRSNDQDGVAEAIEKYIL